jgi:serine/threonine protein kinase
MEGMAMIGETISHYKILEKLSEGGMGVVYKAHDTKLARDVAIKFLPIELTKDENAKRRFIQEAQSAAALDHSNICTIHEIGETEDGQSFFVMNYYEGETLQKKLEKEKLSVDESVDIAIQITQGLAKAHEKGIIHRDIKPANIIITKDGVVKILDFGLTKLSGKTLHTKTGSTLGTVAYVSPEQARGGDLDYRTDIWSLGVVLYQMLTGVLPFKGNYDAVIIHNIVLQEPEPIEKYLPNISNELLNILKQSLKKDASKRYQSMSEMINDLKQIQKDHSKSKPIPFIKTRKKYKILYPILITILLFLIVSEIYIFYPSIEQQNLPIKRSQLQGYPEVRIIHHFHRKVIKSHSLGKKIIEKIEIYMSK